MASQQLGNGHGLSTLGIHGVVASATQRQHE